MKIVENIQKKAQNIKKKQLEIIKNGLKFSKGLKIAKNTP